LEEEVVEAKENTEGNNALKQKYEKEKKAIQVQLEEMNDKYDEEVNQKIKSQKLISELEEQIEELKQKLEEADVRKELEELKSRQEQELELMRFKLEREGELRKKSEEAANGFKQQNEILQNEFDNFQRESEKNNKKKTNKN